MGASHRARLGLPEAGWPVIITSGVNGAERSDYQYGLQHQPRSQAEIAAERSPEMVETGLGLCISRERFLVGALLYYLVVS